MTGHVSVEQSNSLPLSWQRLLALSGVAFAILFLVGWFASGGDAPDHGASEQDWTSWASDNQWKSRIGAFAMLLAGFLSRGSGSIRHERQDCERWSAVGRRSTRDGSDGTRTRDLRRDRPAF
jgi:hypothetical protein